MNTISYSEFRNHLAETMDRVCDDHAPIVIARENSPSVIILSLDEYESLEETTYLLRSPRNARRLFDSIDQLEAGKGIERELVE